MVSPRLNPGAPRLFARTCWKACVHCLNSWRRWVPGGQQQPVVELSNRQILIFSKDPSLAIHPNSINISEISEFFLFAIAAQKEHSKPDRTICALVSSRKSSRGFFWFLAPTEDAIGASLGAPGIPRSPRRVRHLSEVGTVSKFTVSNSSRLFQSNNPYMVIFMICKIHHDLSNRILSCNVDIPFFSNQALVPHFNDESVVLDLGSTRSNWPSLLMQQIPPSHQSMAMGNPTFIAGCPWMSH